MGTCATVFSSMSSKGVTIEPWRSASGVDPMVHDCNVLVASLRFPRSYTRTQGALTMTTDGRTEPLLQLLDTLQQYQLRNAGAEVAAAIAHAMGTPLNVISGRAELIRQDPSNALAQVARIEEQVKKVASGLRQLVDYLAVPDGVGAPFLPSATTSAVDPGSGPATLQSGGVERPRSASRVSPPGGSVSVAGENALTLVSAASVLADLSLIAQPIAEAHGAQLELDGSAVEHVTVDRWHTLAMLNALVSLAIRHVGQFQVGEEWAARASERPRIKVAASKTPSFVVFELVVPELDVLEGWHLEHFQVRPPATQKAEPYRTLSICAAVARGRGGKLQVELAPDGAAALIRFSCRPEPHAA
jgi:signal transduction histidine kinase